MLLLIVLYNGVLGLGLILLSLLLRRRPRWSVALAGLGIHASVSLLLALGIAGGEIFVSARLLSYGFFIHGSLALLIAGLTLWRSCRPAALTAVSIAVLIIAIAVDAFFVEPHWLEISHVEVQTAKLAVPVRIVVLSDLQTDEVGEYEREVLWSVAAQEPDLVLMPGDYLQVQAARFEAVREQLRAAWRAAGITARLGIHAVRGNTERQDWPRIFAALGVTCHEQTTTFDVGELRITALSFRDSFNNNLRIPRSDRFQIVIGHAPDFSLGRVDAELLVAGHTHGGQVRLPVIGPLVTLSDVPRAWAAGMTELDGDRTLVVSRGIGMERGRAPRLRFLCRPELVVIDVVPMRPRFR